MSVSQRRDIAARLRALLGPGDQDLAAVADRLGVAEASLASSLDHESPSQTVDVMVAFIRKFGVDAHWLLFGTYDVQTHREVLESDTGEVRGVVRRLAADASGTRVRDEGADEKLRLYGDR